MLIQVVQKCIARNINNSLLFRDAVGSCICLRYLHHLQIYADLHNYYLIFTVLETVILQLWLYYHLDFLKVQCHPYFHKLYPYTQIHLIFHADNITNCSRTPKQWQSRKPLSNQLGMICHARYWHTVHWIHYEIWCTAKRWVIANDRYL